MILAYTKSHKVGDIVLGVHGPNGEFCPSQPARILRESSIHEWRRVNVEEFGWTLTFLREEEDCCKQFGYVYFYKVGID